VAGALSGGATVVYEGIDRLLTVSVSEFAYGGGAWRLRRSRSGGSELRQAVQPGPAGLACDESAAAAFHGFQSASGNFFVGFRPADAQSVLHLAHGEGKNAAKTISVELTLGARVLVASFIGAAFVAISRGR
jgi:hypothetical protein